MKKLGQMENWAFSVIASLILLAIAIGIGFILYLNFKCVIYHLH